MCYVYTEIATYKGMQILELKWLFCLLQTRKFHFWTTVTKAKEANNVIPG